MNLKRRRIKSHIFLKLYLKMLIVQVLCDVKVVITETLIYASPLLIVAFTIERSRRIRIIFKMLVRSRMI